MKLIIDIPEEEWLFTKAKIVSEDDSYVDRAVANGIPLDNIKIEIEQVEINGHIRDVECFRAGINTALNVIDKYKYR